jgi:hypothetical protein
MYDDDPLQRTSSFLSNKNVLGFALDWAFVGFDFFGGIVWAPSLELVSDFLFFFG